MLLRREQPQVALRVERAYAVVRDLPLTGAEAAGFRNDAVTGYARPAAEHRRSRTRPFPFSIPNASCVLSCPLPLFLEFDVTISIANRILLGFAVIVALMVGLGIYAINQLDDVRQSTETIVTRDLALMRQLEDVSERQNTMRGLREEILSRFFLRSLGQQQGAGDDLARCLGAAGRGNRSVPRADARHGERFCGELGHVAAGRRLAADRRIAEQGRQRPAPIALDQRAAVRSPSEQRSRRGDCHARAH